MSAVPVSNTTPETGITFEEYLQYTLDIGNYAISALSNALGEVRDAALTAAERWERIAASYEKIFDHAATRANYYLELAQRRGHTEQAAMYRQMGEIYQR